MNDYFDNELAVGDEVAFYAPGYRMYTTGTVTDFTPQKVRVSYMNTWNFQEPGYASTYLGLPEVFIKKGK